MNDKRKVGRPIKMNKQQYIITNCTLSIDTLNRLEHLSKISYQSKVGIVRTAIDYLYYIVMESDVPTDLQDIINDLKES